MRSNSRRPCYWRKALEAQLWNAFKMLCEPTKEIWTTFLRQARRKTRAQLIDSLRGQSGIHDSSNREHSGGRISHLAPSHARPASLQPARPAD